MKQKLFILFALFIATMTASAATVVKYNLTVGTCDKGKMTFTVGDATVTEAAAGQTVKVTVAPEEGWETTGVTAKVYTDWGTARSRGIDLNKNISVTGSGNEYSFTMPANNVVVSATFKEVEKEKEKVEIKSSWITLAATTYTYDGNAKTPAVTVNDGDTTLPATAYTVSYSNNVDAGTATVTVTIAATNEDYTGEAKKSFTISPATLTEVTLNDTLFTYAYAEITATVASVKAGHLEVPEEGYTVSGNVAKEIGNHTVTVTGKGNFAGTATAKFRIKEAEPTIDVEAKETTEDGENDGKEVENVTMVMKVAENASETVTTEERTVVNPETGQEEPVEVTVIPIVLESINIPETAETEEITVTVPNEIVNGNVVYKVTEIKEDAFKTTDGTTKVTKVILPETEEPLKVEEGAMKPDGEPVDVVTPLSMLDDYALMYAMKENFEAKKISAIVTVPNRYWTFSSGVDCILPEGITVYIVMLDNGVIRIIPLEEEQLILADGSRGIKANNGVLIACNNGKGGNAFEMVANPGNQKSGSVPATTNAKSYLGNCLLPTIEATNYEAGKILILKDNKFHSIKQSLSKVKPCKAVVGIE